MAPVTATELARNLKKILDEVEFRGREVTVVRNHAAIAQIIPGPGRMTALQAFADLYRTLPDAAAAGWQADGRMTGKIDEITDPWDDR